MQLIAEIDDNGNVGRIVVEKGIGSGCDEEAIRLLENIKFGQVSNRGVRLKIRKKFKIEFKLPSKRSINYILKTGAGDSKTQNSSFNYTIDL
ncbi:MAG: hypothetical protein GX820_02035 [Bacteroidales bacterium]|nr:hypothetical protein [Bacteroidales bacterium]